MQSFPDGQDQRPQVLLQDRRGPRPRGQAGRAQVEPKAQAHHLAENVGLLFLLVEAELARTVAFICMTSSNL